jgi:predicted HicB family RNase H-like nuclease
MARTDPQLNLRLPVDLKAQLDDAARASGRSVTAETVLRLQSSFSAPSARATSERRKLELLAEYAEWCDRHGKDALKSFSQFAVAYDEDNKINGHPDVEHVSGMPTVDTRYLSELYSTWVMERPSQHPVLADAKSDARRALDLFTMVNLIRAEALARGVRVKVTFEGEPNPDPAAALAEGIEAMKGLIKKR